VGVGGDGVGALEAAKERPQPRRDRRHRAVGAVGVEPEALPGTELGELVERIDGARVHRAGVAHDDRRLQSRAPVVGDRLLQQVDADAEAVVGRDLPELLPADAEQVDRLVDAVVDLFRDVHHERLGSPEAGLAHVGRHGAPRGRERREVRHRAARGEDALGAVRKAEDRREPLQDLLLDVDRGVVAAPAIAVHRRREVVGDDAERVGGRVDEGEEARVRVAEGVVQDPLAHRPQHLVGRLPGLRQRLVESQSTVADLTEHGPRGEARAVLRDQLGRPDAELSHFFRVEIELQHA
jgi:hypothetical protein